MIMTWISGQEAHPQAANHPLTWRRIGRVGTWSRVVVGGGLLVLGPLHGHPWGISWYQVVLGMAIFPVIILGTTWVVGRHRSGPLRLTGPGGTMANCVTIIALSTNSVTAAAVELFYGVTLLVAAWRGQPGCEVTVLSNWILRRDDQIGCPIFSPIDNLERRHRTRSMAHNDLPRQVGNADSAER